MHPETTTEAVLCDAFGEPETLRIGRVVLPAPGPGEISIRVEAAGVNFADALIVQGKYQASPAFPFTPGSEIAGFVEAVGPGVDTVRIGDRVMAFTSLGGFAGRVTLEAWRTFAVPQAMDVEVAAGFLVPYGTAWLALCEQGRARPGDWVVVTGAGGGVGTAAIEIAKALGCHVVALASSASKLASATQSGADHAIATDAQDLRGRLKEITGGHGADIVVDTVGGARSETLVRALARHGRYLVIGFAGGTIPAIPLNLLLLKSSSLIGVFWGAEMRADPEAGSRMMQALLREVEAGRIRPRAPEALPLGQAGQALRRLLARDVVGKIVLRPGAVPGAPE